MMSPPLDILFWLAVAILAARVCWEFLWAANHLQRLAATALRPAPQPVRVDLPASAPPRRRRKRKPRTSYIETMSAEEMERLLGMPQDAEPKPMPQRPEGESSG